MNVVNKTKLLCVTALLALILSGCGSNPVKGQWQYRDGGTVISLDLAEVEDCQLSLERFPNKPIQRGCKYEPDTAKGAKEGEYYLFLKNDSGQCGVFPDFEFDYDKLGDFILLHVDNKPFKMHKRVSDK